jgi:hypothetical protein
VKTIPNPTQFTRARLGLKTHSNPVNPDHEQVELTLHLDCPGPYSEMELRHILSIHIHFAIMYSISSVAEPETQGFSLFLVGWGGGVGAVNLEIVQ